MDPILAGKGYEKLDLDYPGDMSFDEEYINKTLDEENKEEEGKEMNVDE